MTNINKLKMPFILWMAVTLYFSFQFILRLSAGILREDIMERFSVDTVSFGTLAGFYYLGYAGMQIPLGFMLDKFNFRLVTIISIITASIGTLTFSFANSWEIVLLGRFLIGAGSGVAFLTVVKVTKTFFPEKMHGMLIGFAFTIGLSGAVIGGTPTKFIFEKFGYDTTLISLAIIALIISLIIFSVNDKKIQKNEVSQATSLDILSSLKLAFNPTILLISISGGLMVGSLEGFADVWAIPYFIQSYNFTEHESIFAVSVVYIGMCFGGPILAWGAQKSGSVISIIFLSGIITTILFGYMFSNETLLYTEVVVLMFILGILCCYQVLVFTLTTQLTDKSYSGIAIAVVNSINMSFGHLFHVTISNIMQSNWDGTLNDRGMPVYSHDTYILSLGIIPILCMIGVIGFIYLTFKNKRAKLNKI